MSELEGVLRRLKSPRELIEVAGHDAASVTSPVIASALDALYGVKARTKKDVANWELVCSQSRPKCRARRTVGCVRSDAD